MSLYEQLRRKNSSVSKWFRTYIKTRLAIKFVDKINDEINKYPIVISPNHTDYALAGTAFKYTFRWLHGPLTDNIVALSGAYFLPYKWDEAPYFVSRVIQEGNATQDLEKKAELSIILAWFDIFARWRKVVPPLQMLSEKQNGRNWKVAYPLVSPQLVDDVVQLAHGAIETWGSALNKPFIFNPIFTGSTTVGGADADWINQRRLYECKCTMNPQPFTKDTLLQALAYVLLDYDNEYAIKGLGWYYARRNVCVGYSLVKILRLLGLSTDLEELRYLFANRDYSGDLEPFNNKAKSRRRKRLEQENIQIREISMGAFDDWCKVHEIKIKETSVEWRPDNRRVITIYMRDDSIEKFLITL